jgi:hypothetical protein
MENGGDLFSQEVGRIAVNGHFRQTVEPSHVDVINERLAPRNLQTSSCSSNDVLETWYTPTPLSTKQSFFATTTSSIKQRNDAPTFLGSAEIAAPPTSLRPVAVPAAKHVYSPKTCFAPLTRKPPFSGFAANVDTESLLRSQFFALQRAEQAVYIPSSKSDLYVPFGAVGYEVSKQPHPLLFDEGSLSGHDGKSRPNIQSIGQWKFANPTRTQLRGLVSSSSSSSSS